MIATIEQATLQHAKYLADRCRPADVAEMAALGVTPLDAMLFGLNSPGVIYTGCADGVPVCMFGVTDASMIGNVGRPWMVATSDLEKHQKAFLRRNRHIIDVWMQIYDVLENYVDARNTQAVKWLMWLGFGFGDVVHMGLDRLPFYKFEMRAA